MEMKLYNVHVGSVKDFRNNEKRTTFKYHNLNQQDKQTLAKFFHKLFYVKPINFEDFYLNISQLMLIKIVRHGRLSINVNNTIQIKIENSEFNLLTLCVFTNITIKRDPFFCIFLIFGIDGLLSQQNIWLQQTAQMILSYKHSAIIIAWLNQQCSAMMPKFCFGFCRKSSNFKISSKYMHLQQMSFSYKCFELLKGSFSFLKR